MKKNTPQLITYGNISEPGKKRAGSLQETKACYENICLPDGWEDTIDPKEYFQANEETRHHLDSDKEKCMKWENLAGHLICLLVLLIFTSIHIFGIHKWAVVERMFPPSLSQETDITEEPSSIPLGIVPTYFKHDVKEINHAIEEKKWGKAEKLLKNIVYSQEIRNESNFYTETLYRVIKTHNLTKKYHLAWNSFIQLRKISDKKISVLPYHVMYAAAQSKYELATNGGHGNGMSVKHANELINVLNQIRTNYSDKTDDDNRFLLFETDALLSSLGKDNEKFDLENQKNIAQWEQFEITLQKLLRHETNTRSVIFLQYRKWLKIKSFCRIPIYNEEQVVIGKYSYEESYAERMKDALFNQMKN